MNQQTGWSGIDVSKEYFDACWVDAQSCVEEFHLIPRARFERTRKGVCAYLKWLDQQRDRQPCRAVVEATGRYSIELIDWLSAARAELAPAMVHPPQAAHYHRSLGLKNKNDSVDARSLALFGRDRQPPAYQKPAGQYRQLRELKRLRDQLRDESTRCRMQLDEGPETAVVARLLRTRVRQVEHQIQQLDSAIDELMTSETSLNKDYQLLISIPGIARKTAVTILGEMGDLRRFTRSRQVAAWAGLSPRQNSSGKLAKPTRIHRGGNARLRQALFLPALSVCRNTHTELGRFYQRLVRRGLSKKAAVVAVMRKLLVLMRAVIVSDQPYDPAY